MKHPINTPVTFPRKLYDLIESESNDIVDWAEHGLAFVVKQPDIFTQEILPKYFRHTKLTSFQRQLNLYGFRRITKGPDQGAYFHPHFQRNKRELLGQIKRLPGKGAMSTPPPKSLYQAAGLHHYAATQGSSGSRSGHSGSDFSMRMNRQANITTRAQSRMSSRGEDDGSHHGESLYESDDSSMMHRHQQQMYASQQFLHYQQQQQPQHHHSHPHAQPHPHHHHQQHHPHQQQQQPQYGYRQMADPQGGYPMQFGAVPGQMMNMGGGQGGSFPNSQYHMHPHAFVHPNARQQPMVSAPMLAPMPTTNHPMYKDVARMPSDTTHETTSPHSMGSFQADEDDMHGMAVGAGNDNGLGSHSNSGNGSGHNSPHDPDLIAPTSRPLMMSGLSINASMTYSSAPLDMELKPHTPMSQAPLSHQQQQQSSSPHSQHRQHQQHHQHQLDDQSRQQLQQSTGAAAMGSSAMGASTGVPVSKNSLMRNVSTNSELWSIPSELGDLELTDLDNLWDPNDPNPQGMTHMQLAAVTATEVISSMASGGGAPSTPMQAQSPQARPRSPQTINNNTPMSETSPLPELHIPMETKLLV